VLRKVELQALKDGLVKHRITGGELMAMTEKQKERLIKTGEYDRPKIHAPKKLDIACGQRKTEGFKGIDMGGNADIVHDLMDFPWPIKASSVKEMVCNHFVEHIPHEAPIRLKDSNWEYDGFYMFFQEVYRVAANGATIEITHPYSRSDRAFWDPTHTRYIHETSYYYLNREWRTAQMLEHYIPDINFDVVTIDGQMIPDDIISRNIEYQNHARTYWFNVVNDLHIILKVVK
jgi:hypothetical protein